MKKLYFEKIIDSIEPSSSVLDLGCGNGELLERLSKEKNIQGYGIEIDYENILNCIQKGLSVLQGDIDEILKHFGNQTYDYVILALTLQETRNPLLVLKEMLRIGKKVIITFPNFAFWSNRIQLLLGSAPVTSALPYTWYETPNIRLITIKDFKNLCKNEKIQILKEIPLYKKPFVRKVCGNFFSNLFLEKGMFILSKSK